MQKGYKIQKFRKGASVFGCNTISCALRNYLCNCFYATFEKYYLLPAWFTFNDSNF